MTTPLEDVRTVEMFLHREMGKRLSGPLPVDCNDIYAALAALERIERVLKPAES